jgi:hypothetical protein
MSGILHPKLRLPCVSASIGDEFDDEPTSTRSLPRRDDFVHVSTPEPDEEDDEYELGVNAWSRERGARMQH